MAIINMLSNSLDIFPEGAYCPIDCKASGHVYVLHRTYVGACIREREANGFHDSDFYMTVWDHEAAAPKEIMFATTRAWTYPCMNSNVDATPEVLAVYAAWEAKREAEYRAQSRKNKADALRAERATMFKAAHAYGVPYLELLRLRRSYRGQYLRVMYLLTARLRNSTGFKASIRANVIQWLKAKPSERRFSTPLSHNQLQYIKEWGAK